jgi:hypothetical protein
MIIIPYVDDCISISDSIKDINTFTKSMKDGPKGYVLTDEGDINNFSWNWDKRNYKEQIWIVTTIPNRTNMQSSSIVTKLIQCSNQKQK